MNSDVGRGRRIPAFAIGTAVLVWLVFLGVHAVATHRRTHFNDFGKFYYSARAFLDGDDMYGPSPATVMPMAEGRSHTFLNMNPPHFHLLVLPFALLSLPSAFALWALASVGGLALGLVAISRELGMRLTRTDTCAALAAVSVCSATWATVVTGQLSWLLFPLVTIAWVNARHGRWTRAGALAGLAVSIKPFLLPLIVLLPLRGEWRGLAAAATMMAAAFASGIAVFGIDAHRQWLAALGAADWSWAAMNASVRGVLSRVLTSTYYFEPLATAPDIVSPLWLVAVGLVVIATAAVLIRDRAGPVDRPFAALTLASLLISPLGWIYYLWLAVGPLLALVIRGNWRDDVRERFLLALAIPGLLCPVPMLVFGQPNPWATITIGSSYFWSALALWLMTLFWNGREGLLVARSGRAARSHAGLASPPIIVGIAGGSASGKTTVVERLVDRLGHDTAEVIAHDRYYRDQRLVAADARAALNFDHPDALETELLAAHLQSLRAGVTIEAPVYDFSHHVRETRVDRIDPRPVVIVEGMLVLADSRLRAAMDLRVFVDTDDETRYARRLSRDVADRGRTAESVRSQYEATVRPMHLQYVEPSRRYADLIVTEGGYNDGAIETLATEILRLLKTPS